MLPANLSLRDDDVTTVNLFLHLRGWVVHQADGPDDLAVDLGLARNISEVRWITDDDLRIRLLALALDTDSLAVLQEDLVNWSVQHVGTTPDGAKPGERLRKVTKTVHWVEVRAVLVLELGDGVAVELHLLKKFLAAPLQVSVIWLEGHGVTDEGHGTGVEASILHKLVGGHRLVLSELRVLWILNDLTGLLEEGLKPPLLHETDEGSLEGFASSARDLVDLLALVDIRAADELEVQGLADLGVNESLDKETVGHDELRDEVNVPVPVVAKLLRSWLAEELLEELGDVEGSAVSTIEVVAVNVQDLLAGNGKKTRQKALLEASATCDHIVCFLHYER